jgi:hypothetical protein
VPPRLEDPERGVVQDCSGLGVVVGDADGGVVDAVAVAEAAWPDLDERFGEWTNVPSTFSSCAAVNAYLSPRRTFGGR